MSYGVALSSFTIGIAAPALCASICTTLPPLTTGVFSAISWVWPSLELIYTDQNEPHLAYPSLRAASYFAVSLLISSKTAQCLGLPISYLDSLAFSVLSATTTLFSFIGLSYFLEIF